MQTDTRSQLIRMLCLQSFWNKRIRFTKLLNSVSSREPAPFLDPRGRPCQRPGWPVPWLKSSSPQTGALAPSAHHVTFCSFVDNHPFQLVHSSTYCRDLNVVSIKYFWYQKLFCLFKRVVIWLGFKVNSEESFKFLSGFWGKYLCDLTQPVTADN